MIIIMQTNATEMQMCIYHNVKITHRNALSLMSMDECMTKFDKNMK